ncbi:MAG: hypothetical protein Kow0037_32300 [Calditrichia bacterium]
MEKWRKVYIGGTDGETFLNSVHGQLGCVSCHGGKEPAGTPEEAHEGMLKDPSSQPDKYCAGCHTDVVEKHLTSIHKTQQGYFTMFSQRYHGVPDGEIPEHFTAEFNAECGKCHATCGQCHISVPNSARGGLVSAHKFNKTPDMTKNCTACHGSRIGDEYLGNNEGYSPDAHWVPKLMRCEACHTGSEMHGDGTRYESKLKVQEMPRCENCHQNNTSNTYHQVHWGELSCNTCHSQTYRNCNSCHVGGSGITGDPYFTFKIGKNPIPEDRNYQWVTLRHIPVSNDTYGPWGYEPLPFYNSMPTWKYTAPHNVRKNAPQTAVDSTAALPCAGSCHNNENLFLRPSDIPPGEETANQGVVVSDDEWQQLLQKWSVKK